MVSASFDFIAKVAQPGLRHETVPERMLGKPANTLRRINGFVSTPDCKRQGKITSED